MQNQKSEPKKSSQKVRVLISETFDPWFNIATEEWIFRDMDPSIQILFLWRNDKTVVIGRFQNPWSECNTQKMEEDGIKLARRHSGGGAVFHDLGNTNFTFLSSKETYDKNINNKIIINALKQFNVDAFASGRNDILVTTEEGEKKISGSAFKETKDRAFHHGTLLINADMSKMGLYLNPNLKKLQSKGITSVRARVINLKDLNSDITHENFCANIIQEFFDYYGTTAPIEILDHEYLQTIPALNEHFKKLSDWNWRFGEAPQFNHQMSERFTWGIMEVHLDVHKAFVEKSQIFSDSLHPEMIEQLMASLNKIPYTKEAFQTAIKAVARDLPMIEDYLAEFEEWICREIS
ncbi:MAG: lipoate--protein ligase [Bacteriovorax sp.]|nr:lipoate--protein ligase [Bacteriovorax sp.]